MPLHVLVSVIQTSFCGQVIWGEAVWGAMADGMHVNLTYTARPTNVRHSWVGSMRTGIFMLSLRTGFFHLCCPTRPQGVNSCGCSWLGDHLNSVVAFCYWHVICHCVQERFYSFLFPPCRLLYEARAR